MVLGQEQVSLRERQRVPFAVVSHRHGGSVVLCRSYLVIVMVTRAWQVYVRQILGRHLLGWANRRRPRREATDGGIVFVLCLVSLLWVFNSRASSQDDRPKVADHSLADDVPLASASSEDDSGRQTRRALQQPDEPDVYLLPDRDGKWKKLLGFRYEDFVKAYNIIRGIGLPQEPPRYSLQRLKITGNVGGDVAQIQLKVDILLNTPQLVGVPIGLASVMVTDPPKVTGSDSPFVHFDQEVGGYVVWLRGETGHVQTVVLNAEVKLADLGDEKVLRLNAPRAASSQLVLEVRSPQAVGRVGEGSLLVSTKAVPRGTQFTVSQLNDEFELAWRESGRSQAKVPTVLEASGAMLVQIDGHSMSTEARLSIRSFGGQFDRFRVRLPPGAELVALNDPDENLLPLEQTSEEPLSKSTGPVSTGPVLEGQLLDVKLRKKTTGPVRVHLVVQQPHHPTGPNTSVELGGFEVVGAVRQFGHVAVGVVGDWYVQWSRGEGVQRVDELPDPLERDDLVAGFEYFRQPFSVTGRLIPRRARVRVEPETIIEIGAEEAQLETKLSYTVRGKKAFSFDVELMGWKIDREELGPPNVFDLGAAEVSADDVLSIPLLQPSQGQIELVIKAHRRISGNDGTVLLPLPTCRNATQTPSTVVVLPDDNLMLIPRPEAMVGLATQRIPPQILLPKRQQDPLYYQRDAARATFAADMRLQAQAISIDVTSQLRLDRQGGQVNQRLAYRVAHEPIQKCLLLVPPQLALDAVEVSLNGQSLSLESPLDATHQAGAPVELAGEAQGTTGEAVLPKPIIGAFELLISYPFPMDRMPPGKSVEISAPLIMPIRGQVGMNEISVTTPQTLQVSYRGGHWVAAALPPNLPERRMHLVAGGRQFHLPLTVRFTERPPKGTTLVERMWIQTWLGRSVRQERVVYRLRTKGTQLSLTLPEGVDPDDVNILLDGSYTLGHRSPSNAQLAIPLPTATRGRSHTLEVQYRTVHKAHAMGALSFLPPRLDGDVWMQHLYWQLLLPHDVHLVDGDRNFSREFVWDWQGFYWQRRPVLTQSQLETWSGAAFKAPIPPTTNQYLFSSVGTINRLRVRTADRSSLILASSTLVLVAGLLWMYVPSIRRKEFFFIAAIVLCALGVRFSEPFLLVAQAAVLGFTAALLAGWLKLILRRRQGHTKPFAHSRSSSQAFPRTPLTPGEALSDSTKTAVTPAAK